MMKVKNNIKTLLNEYTQATDNIAKRIVNELKDGAKTYKQVDKELEVLKKESLFGYSDQRMYIYLLNKVKQMIESEKNDLPVTNRSKDL